MKGQGWTREELILAFNLYCKTPFTKINSNNKGVKELSQVIGRSISAVALKLANLARLDPALKERNITGMRHGSKAEEEIWKIFNENWDELAYESERILANYKGASIEDSSNIVTSDLPKEGLERDAIVRARVNQNFFRRTVLASYDNRCCITGITLVDLLVAGHIIPWSTDKTNRVNPANGLCLNALHDKAFDRGLITVSPEYKVKLSKQLIEGIGKKVWNSFFLPFEGRQILLPQKFRPPKEFLIYHNQNIFRG